MAVSSQMMKMAVFGMSDSVQKVYRTLEKGKPMKVGEIQRRAAVSSRTVRHALNRLRSNDMIEQIPDLRDLRSHFYRVKIEGFV